MKALIVDDEAAAVIAVKLLVDWEKNDIHTIYEVNSAEDVLPLIRSEEIQLIISDVRMPGMTGLELISEIHKIRPNTKIIMMSGFGQFDYVRSALQQGCVDYILKPIDEKQINDAVVKAVREWKREVAIQNIEHSYREINSQMEKKQAQRHLMTWLNSENPSAAFEQLCALMPGFRGMKACRIASIYTLHLPESGMRGENDISVLVDMANDIAYSTGKALAITRRINSNILLFFNADLPGLVSYANQILSILSKKSGIHLVMGISDPYPMDEAFQTAAVEARERARHCPLNMPDKRYLDQPFAKKVDYFDFEQYEEELHKAALSSYDHTIRNSVKECARIISSCEPMTIALVEKIRYDYLNMRIRWIEGFRLNRKNTEKKLVPPVSSFDLPITEQGDFSRNLLEEYLEEDLLDLAEFFRETVGKKDSDNVLFQQIEQYLLMNYTDKLSLSLISEKFAVSESYLSRAFKKNIGMGITEYINQLRIQKAKELLVNPQIRVADIAQLTGYSDEKYFSRVFRKVEGISPQQYRSRYLSEM